MDTLKTSFRNNANVRTVSANFLHILDEVGVQARKNQYTEVCTFNIMPINSFIAVDFETATFSKMACQIGVTIVENGVIKGTAVDYIQPPDNRYEMGCIKVHHITPEQTINEPTFDKIWPHYKDLFENYPIVAHNAPFDESVLRANLDYYGISHNNIAQFICTYQIYSLSLDKLCWAFNLHDDQHHDAGFDSLRCAQFYKFYLEGIKPDLSRLANYIPEDKRQTKIAQHKQLTGDVLRKDLTNADPNNPFYNKKVVITGVFNIERNELAQKLKSLGADLDTGISKRTNYVFVGTDAGPSKLCKLQSLIEEGYPIRQLNQDDVTQILNGNFSTI